MKKKSPYFILGQRSFVPDKYVFIIIPIQICMVEKWILKIFFFFFG